MTRPYRRCEIGPEGGLCHRCEVFRPAAAFRLIRGRWRSSWCNACAQERTRVWRAQNHETVLAKQRERQRAAYVPVADVTPPPDGVGRHRGASLPHVPIDSGRRTSK